MMQNIGAIMAIAGLIWMGCNTKAIGPAALMATGWIILALAIATQRPETW